MLNLRDKLPTPCPSATSARAQIGSTPAAEVS